MGKFFIPTTRPKDWQQLLAKPKKHWRGGFSAKALAHAWEEAEGFPPEVRQVLSDGAFPVLRDVELLLALPEYNVPLPGGQRSSRNDIFVLGKTEGQLIAITIEGKVKEPFDKLVGEWLKGIKPNSGKPGRLQFLKQLLEIEDRNVDRIRYQLLHRTASALLLAEQFNAPYSMMLVHSFSQENAHFEDYRAFLNLLDVGDAEDSVPNSVSYVGKKNGVDLYLAWVRGEERFLRV